MLCVELEIEIMGESTLVYVLDPKSCIKTGQDKVYGINKFF